MEKYGLLKPNNREVTMTKTKKKDPKTQAPNTKDATPKKEEAKKEGEYMMCVMK